MHQGFKKAGIKTTTTYAIEIEGRYLDSSKRNNPEVFNKDIIFINSDIALVNHSAMLPVEGTYAGIPCKASTSGISKNKLIFPEDHSRVSSCFLAF